MKATPTRSATKTSSFYDCYYCKSELSESEKDFYPCQCAFQACVNCYKDVLKNKKLCPVCKSSLKFDRIEKLVLAKKDDYKKPDSDFKSQKNPPKKTTVTTVVTTVPGKSTTVTTTGKSNTQPIEENNRFNLKKMSFSELSRLRVIQKNLVYVIGLAPQLATDDTLKKFEYFGQYGTVTKVVVNKQNAYNPGGPNGPSYSAYLTFSNDIEASIAILAVDQYSFFDRMIRASYGTTKYCTFFLRDQPCPNSECLYLHTTGKDQDCFVKDEIVSNKNIFYDQQQLAFEHLTRYQKDANRVIKESIAQLQKKKAQFPTALTVQSRLAKYIEEIEREKENKLQKPLSRAHSERAEEHSVSSTKDEQNLRDIPDIKPLEKNHSYPATTSKVGDYHQKTEGGTSNRSSDSNLSTADNSLKKDVEHRESEEKGNRFHEAEAEKYEEEKEILKEVHDTYYDRSPTKGQTETLSKSMSFEEIDNMIAESLLENKNGATQSRFAFAIDEENITAGQEFPGFSN